MANNLGLINVVPSHPDKSVPVRLKPDDPPVSPRPSPIKDQVGDGQVLAVGDEVDDDVVRVVVARVDQVLAHGHCAFQALRDLCHLLGIFGNCEDKLGPDSVVTSVGGGVAGLREVSMCSIRSDS